MFRGSLENVLDRYYRCAKSFRASTIIRLTGDCPFISPEIIDFMVDQFNCQSYDYISNTANDDFLMCPMVWMLKFFSMSALSRAWREAYLDFELEHVTPWFRNSCSNISWSHIQYSETCLITRLIVDDSALTIKWLHICLPC